jgi:glycosyltransferase involved in cell wall biosynthesis
MRILNITETYAPFFEFGGPPVKVHALGQRLAKLQGNQVSVLTADWGMEKRLPSLPPEIRAERSPFGWRLTEGPVQSIYLHSWLRYRTLTWNPAIKRYCRARLVNFDVVHIFGLYDLFGPAVADFCREKKLPYVVEPIGMFVPIVRNLWLKRLYHRVLGKRLLEGASAVVATSEQEVLELRAGGVPREKIVMRPNGVTIPEVWPVCGTFRAQQGISRDTKLILFLGRLSTKKSPDLLLAAFAKLPEQLDGEPVHLVFAGPDEGALQSKLEQLAAQRGLASRVHFLGAIFDQAKWSAYLDADVFVLPSQNENFGNTAAESVAAGTPVIVTEQCGIAPFLRNRAGIVIKHDVSELTEALASLLTDQGLHDRLAAGCPAVAAELNWDRPVRQMQDLYGSLIAKTPSARISAGLEQR